ncbi:TetR/AcrR family transcriptional regulator [Nocardia vinacea]|uniref:TetR/AcrR family transcriptional regulator n=1 Tax=Nocardia vinacea TaxID=96468 RepID=UPI001C3F41CE|nr:TetR/AcrR family transcriptional regulator [Nocardia vinacea]
MFDIAPDVRAPIRKNRGVLCEAGVGGSVIVYAVDRPTVRMRFPSCRMISYQLEIPVEATVKAKFKAPLKSETNPSASALERRAEIVSKAAALFDEMGYHSTSMDDIARAVGLAKPTLYHYYRSKDAILVAIHEEIISLLHDRQLAREAEDSSPAEQLHGVMFDILDLMRTHPGHVRVYFEHRRELPDDAREEAQKARNEYFYSVRKIFEAGQLNGDFTGSPNLSTIALFSLCNSAYQWYGSPDGPYSTREAADYFYGLILNGVAARG